jgi:hypothetical protein
MDLEYEFGLWIWVMDFRVRVRVGLGLGLRPPERSEWWEIGERWWEENSSV